MNQPNCCDKCHTIYTLPTYPEGTTFTTCINAACSCHTTPASTEPKDSWEERLYKVLGHAIDPMFCGDLTEFIRSLLSEERSKLTARGELATVIATRNFEAGKKVAIEEAIKAMEKDSYYMKVGEQMVKVVSVEIVKDFLSTESTSK